MRILDRIAGRTALTVHVTPHSSAQQGTRGDRLVSVGCVPASPQGEALSDENATSNRRAVHFQVVGTHHMPSALRDERFAAGSKVSLRRAAPGADDAHSVEVWDAAGEVQVGYAPPNIARALGAELRRREHVNGVVARELRLGSASGERLAIYVIAGPGRVELVQHDLAAA